MTTKMKFIFFFWVYEIQNLTCLSTHFFQDYIYNETGSEIWSISLSDKTRNKLVSNSSKDSLDLSDSSYNLTKNRNLPLS